MEAEGCFRWYLIVPRKVLDSKLQVRRQRKEESRNAQSWLRRKKVDLSAESTWGHLSIAPGRKVVVFQSQSSWYRP
jgi:hypothetical protein